MQPLFGYLFRSIEDAEATQEVAQKTFGRRITSSSRVAVRHSSIPTDDEESTKKEEMWGWNWTLG